jgi:hypothetical protein
MFMDFEALVKELINRTGCEAEKTGDEQDQEYTLGYALEDNRKQELIIFPFEEEGKELVRLVSFIGKRQDFSNAKLISFLELNMSLRFGAFAIYQGQVALVSTVGYESILDADEVTEHLAYITKMADNFERTLVGLDRK